MNKPLRDAENRVPTKIPTWIATAALVLSGAFLLVAGCSGVFLLEGF